MIPQEKVIGIVGGLGPYAHLDFEKKLLEAARRLIGASSDQDFPEWVLSSLPQTPDRTAAYLGDDVDPVPFLVRSVERLERAGADFVVIACNTAHLFLDEVGEQTTLPILSLIAAAADEASRLAPGGSVGLLATTGTLLSRLYHRPLHRRGLTVSSLLDLDDGEALQRRLVMEAIYGPTVGGAAQRSGIKSGGSPAQARALLSEAAQRLVEGEGVDLLLAGCTEIPLALRSPQVAGRPLLDPARALAEAAIRLAYGR